jgi:hypothetical protein
MEPTKTAETEPQPKVEPNFNWFVIFRDKDGAFVTTTANSVAEAGQIQERLASEKPDRDIWVSATVTWHKTKIVAERVQPDNWMPMQQGRCVN